MASETVTREDLKAVLNEVLPPTPSEYKKLLWTNTQGAQSSYSFTADFSEYDELEVVFERSGGAYTFKCSTSGTASFVFPYNDYLVQRTATISGNTFTFNNGSAYTSYNSGGSVAYNYSYAVPSKVYGIKYERVEPPQIDALAWKLQGTATGTTPITLPSSWEELCVMISGLGYTFTFNIPYLYVSGGSQHFLNGYANNGAGSYWSCEIEASATSCRAIAFSYSGQGSITTTLTVFYR